MSFKKIPAGNNLPEDIYVIIEISSESLPVKYEVSKSLDILIVDRFLNTPLYYPGNYGYINKTLSLDGDPIDVLVITQYPLIVGSVINSRPIGLLRVIDESGVDNKIISVPSSVVTGYYDNIKNIFDLSNYILDKIVHFFKYYKSLDKDKWVKVGKFENVDIAKKEISLAYKRFKNNIF